MHRRRVFFALVLVVGLSVLVLIVAFPRTAKVLATYALTANGSHKTILYWNDFFGEQDFTLGEGYVASHCPRFKNCFATHSRFIKSVENFDAIIFHGINTELNVEDLPARRKPQQRYIFMSLESPANRFIDPRFDGYFNNTLTYQLDSDVLWPYAGLVMRSNENILVAPTKNRIEWRRDARSEEEEVEEEQLMRLIKGKRKLATWYRSNCVTKSKREKYIAELERHIPVAKSGICSEVPGCPRDQDCFKIDVEPNYLFYLSFENSLCEDYVTEKFFQALEHYVVPVVYGGADYTHFAPPNSYINALDFNTPKDLANYLRKISKNITAYRKYFDWKKQYRVVPVEQRIICDLCELLNSNQRNNYDISEWYSTNRCPLQHQLYKQESLGGLDYATRRTLSIH